MTERFTEHEIVKGFQFWHEDYIDNPQQYSEDPEKKFTPQEMTDMLLWCVQEAKKQEPNKC